MICKSMSQLRGAAALLLCGGLVGALPMATAAEAIAPDAKAFGRLNDTGQTLCLDGAVEVACPAGTGQDGGTGRDVTRPNASDGMAGFSFVKVGPDGQRLPAAATQWSCVADKVTGLLWEVKAADGGLRDYRGTYTNHGDGRAGDASAFVEAVNAQALCGYSDWRLPTRTELQSLVNYGIAFPGPAIDQSWFPNTLGSAIDSVFAGYWTGTNYASTNGTHAWYVHYFNGFTSGSDRGGRQAVRVVRSGTQGSARHYVARGSEVLDTRTGLIWQRCSDGQSWDASAQTCAGTAKRYEWLTAMDRAKVLSAATGQKWRLPNLKEMSSIVDEARSNPAMDPVVFPATPTTSFWVSNHSSNLLGEPWLHWSGDGYIDTSYATFKYAVRFVRDASR